MNSSLKPGRMLFCKSKGNVKSEFIPPKHGKIIYNGATHKRAIPNPLIIFLFSPRKENISFGFMTRAVNMRTGIMTIKSLTTLFSRLPDVIPNKDVIFHALFHNSAIITLAMIE